MSRATVIIALVGSILVVPLLCTAGVADHECICTSTECCEEETTCEPDPCDAVYEKQDRRKQDQGVAHCIIPPLARVAASSPGEGLLTTCERGTCSNLPYPNSDIPLRI